VRANAYATASVEGFDRLRSEAPISLRPAFDALYVVASAGGPIGGDDLTLSLRVEPGASLRVRSPAAQVVLPSRNDEPSHVRVEAVVAAGGHLDLALEPTVLAAGCRHSSEIAVDLAPDAALDIVDVVVLGRWGEAPGTAASRLRITVEGQPFIHHELDLHESSIGSAHVVGIAACVEPAWSEPGAPPACRLGPKAWWLPADGPGGIAVALGGTVAEVRALLDASPRGERLDQAVRPRGA